MPLTSRSSGGSRLAAVSLSPAVGQIKELRLPGSRYGSVWIRMRGERGKLARSALRSGVEKPDTGKKKARPMPGFPNAYASPDRLRAIRL